VSKQTRAEKRQAKAEKRQNEWDALVARTQEAADAERAKHEGRPKPGQVSGRVKPRR
jgi:hypothetical protein